MNLANAIVIVGCLYFMLRDGFNIWILFILLFGLATWGHWGFPKESKEALAASIGESKARELNLNAGSRLMVLQSKLIEQSIRN